VDWTTAKIPAYDELPHFRNFPGCAWSVWGAEDQLGTVNLLTETLVKQSAAREIRFVDCLGFTRKLLGLTFPHRTGKTVSLNWQVLNFVTCSQYNYD
jgi:hypothetical protein